jgi:sulfur transfer protein SufE
VTPVWIIPALDEGKDSHAGLDSAAKATTVEQFAFEGREEAFAHRDVVSVAHRPMDGRTPASLQRFPKATDVY